MERVEFRSDRGRLNKVESLAGGGIRINAALTRVGVFTYEDAAGNVSRELKPPEEVFSAKALAGLKDAPVTVEHPSDFVGPENWKEHAVGHVATQPSRDPKKADTVCSSLAIHDGKTIEKINNGDLKEVSLGYFAEITDEPGVFEGQKYDRVQRNVVYNHVALGGHDWGRLGPEISLRLNRSSAVTRCDGSASMVEPRKEAKMSNLIAHKDGSLQIDGKTFNMLDDVEEARGHLAKRAARMRSTTNARTQAIVESTIRMGEGTLEGAKHNAEMRVKLADLKAKRDEIYRLAAKRGDLIFNAKSLSPGLQTYGKSDREIVLSALQTAGFEVNDDASVGYLRGILDSALLRKNGGLTQDLSGLMQPRLNSFDSRIAAAERARNKRSFNAWKPKKKE